MSHIIGVLNCSCKIKLTVKHIVAHGVKADRLSSVGWKDSSRACILQISVILRFVYSRNRELPIN